MATRVDTAKDTAQDAQEHYFRVTDQVPEEVWYWAALGSIIVSASLFLMGKRDWSIFVGQWPRPSSSSACSTRFCDLQNKSSRFTKSPVISGEVH